MDRWCARRQIRKGAVVPVRDVWRLAGPWYADRLDADWGPRSADDMERLFAAAGFTGEFWRITEHSRG